MGAELTPQPPNLAGEALAAVHKFLPALDSGQMKQTHGFAPTDDFKDLTLGAPFEPFYLNPKGIHDYAGGKLTDVLEASASWYFPISSHGKLACLVSVIRLPEGKVVEEKLGMPELARAWAAIVEAWPAEKGYTPRFVVVPSQQRFFFTVPQAEPPNLTPIFIEKAESARSETYRRLTPAGEAFASIRD